MTALIVLRWRARHVRFNPVAEMQLRKINCAPVPGSGDPLKAGVFAGIHGDEPSGIEAALKLAAWAKTRPAELAGFELHLYPECNPTGLAARTRHCHSGLDLNREFWCGSEQPEAGAKPASVPPLLGQATQM